MIKHANISVFVPHIGCPNRCSFCNQNHITGKCEAPTAITVDEAVRDALKNSNFNSSNTELAFFGGSFTAIDEEYRLELLSSAYKYVKNGTICGIRISTRPDAISEEIVEELKNYGVTAVELGAQSMVDSVLQMNRRGHTANDVIKASEIIKNGGLELGLQMMTGLLGDTDEGALYTAQKIASLMPDTVRIYPTIVLKNTYLEKAFLDGTYKPQSVEDAANLSAKLLRFFESKGINVIRVGLHSIDNDAFVAGPWHAAFGEIVKSKIYLKEILNALKDKPKGNYVVFVNPSEISKATGQKKDNITKLAEFGYVCKIKGDNNTDIYSVKIKEE
jgi:histone acetyltransferase (RNA polymerase elongator complex component)